MKNLQYSFYFLIGFVLLNNGCKKDIENPELTPKPPAPTIIKIVVTNSQGFAQPQAFVTLYTSLMDFDSQINPYDMGSTDNNGVATFTQGITAPSYLWRVTYGCQKNTGNECQGTITTNTTNIFNVHMLETGTLQLLNTSSDPYQITYYGFVNTHINGGELITINPMYADSIQFRLVQLSGFTNNPFDTSFYAVVSCGDTTKITFP